MCFCFVLLFSITKRDEINMLLQQYRGFKSPQNHFFGRNSCFEFLGPKSSQNVLFKFVELFSEIIRTLTKNDCEETFLEILVLQSVN